ncbi:hypothetical protein J1786_01680 [Rahnella sp. L72c]|uniref:Uncharacterized protein n=1 Tax=Rahnella perminowiae TaxID=2816244 RepID=A0ABS6KWY0_9GAMM|nr:hypothetical protein [Rahnella perminowiae]MBU9833550.1 hypothetical protein [Rahnella perminowiae]
MYWLPLLAYFSGLFPGKRGAALRERPFAKPPGEGLPFSTIIMLWNFFNIIVVK